jgi:hypothetical protein
MQVTQLYIENERIDLFKDEVISLTQTIQNVRDIEKVFTDFSKSFTIPASKANNKIFKHYYNFDIDNGFDARKKVTARIEINHLPFRDGKIKLEGVDLRGNKAYAYKITFFGNTVNLKDRLGETKLSALAWLGNFTQDYTSSQVRSILTSGGQDVTVDSTTYTDAITCPLITHTTQLFYDSSSTSYPAYPDPSGGNLYPSGSLHRGVYYGELKYAIRLWLIVKAIEEADLGITFTSDSFIKQTDNPQFYNLYMWMHRKKGSVFEEDEDITDLYTSFTPDTSSMTDVDLDTAALTFIPTGATHTLNYTLYVITSTSNNYTIEIKKDGVTYATKTVTGGGQTQLTGTLVTSWFGYEIYVTGTGLDTFSFNWQLTDNYWGESNTYTGSSQALGSSYSFNPLQQLPDMKIIDFLSGLFRMFNLTAYEVAGEIKVQPLDDFYSGGTTRDITDYVGTENSSVNSALPFKEIEFGYEGRGTKLAEQFEQEQGIGWGTIDYRGEDDEVFDGEVYKVTLPFEHAQYSRIKDANGGANTDVQFGWYVDDNDDPYFGQPLLFYPIQITNGTEIRFLNDLTSSQTDIDDYTIPSNSVSTNSTTDDDTCHFSVEINEYTPTGTFDGSLFANYYQDYISDVFNSKRRLTKVKSYLPVGFLISYTLADTLRIATREYKINSITTNLNTGESDLELLNVV